MAIHQKLAAGYPYFLTMTVVDWVDLFSRPVYKHLMVDSLNYCVANKGMAEVVMVQCLVVKIKLGTMNI